MLFTSISFLYYFLPITLLIYFLIPNKYKNYILLLSSLIFYLYGDSKYLFLIIFEIIIAYLGGRILETKKNPWYLWLFLAVILGLLGYFKYIDFILISLNNLFHTNIALLNVALPIGISFYTFQIISYLVDVYKDKTKSEKNIFHLATYIALFPQLIAGPIVRYETIKENLNTKDISLSNMASGIKRLILGLGKKVIIANSLGLFCTAYLNSPDKSVIFSIMYAICYSLQVFFDFAGYTDMAIGLGFILGFHFPENFDYPFTALSITDFWRRWHMTLGTFFRDYVYIPLGGSRGGSLKLVRNIIVVWTLTGLWHGAAWNFVFWGLYFGLLLLIEKLIFPKYLTKIPKFLKHFYVIFSVAISFVLFGSATLREALEIYKNIFFLNNLPLINTATKYYLHSYQIFIILGLILSTPVLKVLIEKLKTKPVLKKAINFLEPIFLFLLLIIVTANLVDNSYNPFLYFRF